MNKGITVLELAQACAAQIKKGNGNKHILITTDDEANGYHTLFYTFGDSKADIRYALELEHDSHTEDEVVLLG